MEPAQVFGSRSCVVKSLNPLILGMTRGIKARPRQLAGGLTDFFHRGEVQRHQYMAETGRR